MPGFSIRRFDIIIKMNLYDKDDGFKQFRIDEANALLPRIISKTEEALSEIKKLRKEIEAEEVFDNPLAQHEYDEKSALILQSWSAAMVELGVYPKGFFTVDFKSPIPDTLYCWTHGETEIEYTHKIYESFKERRTIQNHSPLGFEGSLN